MSGQRPLPAALRPSRLARRPWRRGVLTAPGGAPADAIMALARQGPAPLSRRAPAGDASLRI
ncbi:MAG: hypothetical protein KGJ43_04960, partial [Acidobacteriota bacterium]|nr:hypothetical protein [Acidobacteriota bacterium]